MDFIVVDDVSVKAETVLSTESIDASSLTTLYPNPVNDTFQIQLSNDFNTENLVVIITDLAGKEVQIFLSATSYNVSELQIGIYIVKVTDGVNTKLQKLIKK